MANTPNTTGNTTSRDFTINEEKKRIAVLRQSIRDASKEIKQLESTTRREADMAEWKMISDLKQKFIKELKGHSKLKRMSWKRFNSHDDYFIYARNVGQYTHYAVDDTAEWVQKAVKSGISLVELEANAKRMREGRWDREQRRIRAAQKAEKDKQDEASKDLIKSHGKKAKRTDEEIHGKGNLEEMLGNG